jgi:hypothetical protein
MVAMIGLSITGAGFAWVDMTIKEALVVNLLSAFSVTMTIYFWVKAERLHRETENLRREIEELMEELHKVLNQNK